jgi:hypothetical protein
LPIAGYGSGKEAKRKWQSNELTYNTLKYFESKAKM